MAAQTVYYISSQGIKFAWRAPAAKYTSLLATIGARKAGTNETGLVFGANQPRLPRLRVNLKGGKSQIIFCSPDKTADCTIGNKLRGKKTNNLTIESCSYIGTRT